MKGKRELTCRLVRSAGASVGGLIVLCAVGPVGGCYQHVVSARGFGAERIETHEPSVEPDIQPPPSLRRQVRDAERSAPTPPRPY